MFSRLLFVRLKAAENALRDGRVDEAYRLATAPDIREHRRGAAVLSKLAKQFLERARTHFRADRFTEALMDLERAEAGDGVLKEEIAELREHVQTVASAQRSHDESRRQRIETARRRVEGGSVAAGRKILEQASADDADANALRRDVDDRADDAASVVQQAERLLVQGQLAAAAERVRQAKRIDAHLDSVTRIETRVCSQAFENARAAIREGKPSRASDELSCLGDLGKSLPARRELGDLLALTREAARCITDSQYAEARRHAMSLRRLLPDANWVEDVVALLRQAEDARTALRSGPLGGRGVAGDGSPQRASTPASLSDTVALPGRGRHDGALPQRLLLLVDGGGSYLILRGDRISLGRVASKDPADVPVFSDVAERHANINRVDDDYFLFSSKEVDVGGRRIKQGLLRHEDRLVLGRKAKFTFRLPSRQSPSAVLDLSDTTKVPNDVRRVVLFHRHARLGAGAHAHIRCQHAGPPLIMFERNGALWIRQQSDGHVDTDAVQLTLGEPVEIAGASLVLQPWEVRTPGMRKT